MVFLRLLDAAQHEALCMGGGGVEGDGNVGVLHLATLQCMHGVELLGLQSSTVNTTCI